MTDILTKVLSEHNITLDATALERFARYAELLARRAVEINLVADASPEVIARRHFADSLIAIRLPASASSLIDVGTGAGFPGIPLKIANPSLALTLLDSNGKRCAFVREVVDTLSLDNVSVICGRAEDVSRETQYRERYDYATARAVTDTRMLAELCLPFVRVGGVMFAMKSRRAIESGEFSHAAKAIATLGGCALSTHEYELDGASLVTLRIQKVKPTPDTYPRPWAKIKKSPL